MEDRSARPVSYGAEISSGLEATDPRLPVVLNAIEECDGPFMQNDKAAFLVAAAEVIMAMEAHDDEPPDQMDLPAPVVREGTPK